MMKIASFWAVALSLAPASVLAQGTPTSASTTTTSAAAPTCTASLITKLCDYKKPISGTAVAIGSREGCTTYCHTHQPCSFTIFVPGNPNLDPQPGTCWVYPGESYDESLGTREGCNSPYLEVFGKPECTGTPTTPETCAATNTPKPIAETCDYPAPDTCVRTCVAIENSSKCLSYCVDKAESCAYAIFRPGDATMGPNYSGTCWIYTTGAYDSSLGKTCSGATELYVYDNPCPKPKSSSSSASPSASGTGTSGSGTTELSEGGATSPSETPKGSASGVRPFGSLAVGAAVLVWLGF